MSSPASFLSFFIALTSASLFSPGFLLARVLDGIKPHSFLFDGAESVEYRASWNGIPVATAEVRAGPTLVDGKKFYQVQIQAKTWQYLDPIWKMRDTIESVFDSETLHPQRFIFHQRENRKSINTRALFDLGSNKWVVHRDQGRKIKNYEFISQHALDPVLAVYLARSQDLRIGESLQMEIFGGKNRYLLLLDIVGRERVTVKAGDFDAYRIVPRVINLNRSGYAGRMREATLWVSADEKKRPLKMTAQVFIGSVNIEMVEARI